MSLADDLSLGFSNRRIPIVLQTEAAECGLACLAMVASFHGYRVNLAAVREKHSISLKGTTLGDLIKIAEHLQLASRPLKLEQEQLSKIQLPCILHWNFDHYVVLKRLTGKFALLHDPAVGERKLSMKEFSASFTGVALELWPNTGFRKIPEAPKIALRRLMGRVNGLYRSFGQALLLALALEVFGLLNPFFLQWVVDQAIVAADRDLLTTLAIGFALLTFVKVIVGAVRSWVLMHMSTLVNVQWRANVFTHLLRLPVSYFQKRHLGDINSRFGSIDQIQSTLTTSFMEAILDGVMSGATLIMMFVYSRLLGIIATITVLLYGLCRWVWYGALRTATHSQIAFAAKQQSHFLESIRGVRTIKLFQREDQRRTSWLSILVDQINSGLRTQKLQIIYSSINSLLTGVETILVIWFGARMILAGEFTVGSLMAFKLYDDQFTVRSAGLVDKLLQFKMLRLYGERLADIVLTEPERSSEFLGAEQNDLDIKADITVSQLRYRYADQDPYVLNGVSFEVSEGQSVAIVGPSGCGKSTLMNVLLGVLKPTSGDIMIGGIRLAQLGPDRLRRMVGSVMQDDVLFAGSIRDNISFFSPGADVHWIEQCAKIASVHEEILAMPMGYNSLVGDMGTVLSGGQKQRVLLARALYKRPRILFLDEATSHLDIEKERAVNAGIKALNITRVIVAHRPETIATANRVILLMDGKVDEDQQRPGIESTVPPIKAVGPDALAIPRLRKAPPFMSISVKPQ